MQEMQPQGPSCLIIGIITVIIVLLLPFAGILLLVKHRDHAKRIAEPVGGSSAGTDGTDGTGIDCSGVASVQKEYLTFVQGAAKQWLRGDEAALIALIQVESGWNRTATNPNSSAAGFGQFISSTARGMTEFNAAKIYDRPNPDRTPDDDRFVAEKSIYAAAHYLSRAMERYDNNLREAYERGYHTYRNAEQERAAKAAGARLASLYDKLRSSGGCKSSGDAGSSPVDGTGKFLKVPYVKEKTGGDCGQASILMVALYYNPNLRDSTYLEKASDGRWQTRDNINCVTPDYLNRHIPDSNRRGWTRDNSHPSRGLENVKRSLAGGDPVVFFGSKGLIYSSVHIFVITGWDPTDNTFYVNNPYPGGCECDPSTKTPNGKRMTEESLKRHFGGRTGDYMSTFIIRGKYL